MKLTGAPQIFDLDPYANSNTQQHNLGSIAISSNGDAYRYTRIISTGTDLVAGHIHTALAGEANHLNRVLGAAVAIGATSVEVAVGATAVDANEYNEGTLAFNDVSPEGETYFIESHDASTGSEDITVVISPSLKTAATTSSQVELIRNPWNNPAVSQLITTRAVGVAIQDWDVSVANFGWLKTRGVAAVLADTTASTIGHLVAISNQTDGAVGALGTIAEESPVGQTLGISVATEFNSVYLTID